MKVFIWYVSNAEKNESMKIYAVAETIQEARGQVIKVLPSMKDITENFLLSEPQVFSVPFAEVNTFKDGKGAAFVAAEKLGL